MTAHNGSACKKQNEKKKTNTKLNVAQTYLTQISRVDLKNAISVSDGINQQSL